MSERAAAMRGNRSSQQHPGFEDAKFRGNPVSFRTAGQFDANVLVNPRHEPAGTAAYWAHRAEVPSAVEPANTAPHQLPVRPSGNAGRVGSTGGIPLAVGGGGERAPLFMVDVKGSDALHNTGFEPPQPRSPSPAPSDSSQDVVVFRGRSHASAPESNLAGHGGMSEGPSSTFAAPGRQRAAPGGSGFEGSGQSELADSDSDLMQLNTPEMDSKNAAVLKKTIASGAAQIKLELPNRNRSRNYLRPKLLKSDDGGLDDYVMNVLQHADEEDAVDEGVVEESVVETVDVKRIAVEERVVEATVDEDLLSFSPALDMRHVSNGFSVVVEKRTMEERVSAADISTDAFLAAGLEGDQDASASDDRVTIAIERILDKRVRRGNVQYLVVWRGSTADEAQWKRKDSLTTSHATELIRRFEAENKKPGKHEKNIKATMGTDSDESDSEDDFDDEVEDDVASNRGDDPDWEVSDDEDDDAIDMVTKAMKAGLVGMGDAETRATRSGRVYARALDLPSDLTGLEPPKVRKKGGRRSLPFELSDPELEEKLTKAWEKDRKKKSEHKRHRQELREQGLLGKKSKTKASRTWEKGTGQRGPYHEIRLRIRRFVMSPDQVLQTPPMAKFQRHMAHNICAFYCLQSKSFGSGDKRYTQISKTPRSLALANDEDALQVIDRRLGHRNESTTTTTTVYRNGNATTAARSRTTVTTTKKKSGGGFAAASYRDGDVVGASAPEIGVDNRGRAMLEKMGWSKGTALGAMDNKGILQPVAHVVKTSKAGLG